MCGCVYDLCSCFCAFAGVCLCMFVSMTGKGKGSVLVGSGLTAGYNRGTLNSRLICLTGGEQCTCI